MSEITSYEVNSETMAILPELYGDKVFSRVLEEGAEYIVAKSPIDVMKYSCQFFGSSLEGRVFGSQKLLNISHKVPIVMDVMNSLYFFPTQAASRSDCCWLSLEHVDRALTTKEGRTNVRFRNKKMLEIPISHNMIQNQLYRAALLKTKILQNIGAYQAREKRKYIEI